MKSKVLNIANSIMLADKALVLHKIVILYKINAILKILCTIERKALVNFIKLLNLIVITSLIKTFYWEVRRQDITLKMKAHMIIIRLSLTNSYLKLIAKKKKEIR